MSKKLCKKSGETSKSKKIAKLGGNDSENDFEGLIERSIEALSKVEKSEKQQLSITDVQNTLTVYTGALRATLVF